MLFRIDQVCFPPGIAYSRAELRYYLQHQNSFSSIAETDAHRIAGFCIGQLHARADQCFGHIITIDVLPDARGQGVGRLLLNAIEARFRVNAAISVRLEVAVDNLGAQAFYREMGYGQAGKITNYYAGKLDALVLQKQLMGDG